jgi:hypothetical protein
VCPLQIVQHSRSGPRQPLGRLAPVAHDVTLPRTSSMASTAVDLRALSSCRRPQHASPLIETQQRVHRGSSTGRANELGVAACRLSRQRDALGFSS